MLAAPHDLIDLIDPWREPQPPHGATPGPGSGLARAYRLRQQTQPGRFDWRRGLKSILPGIAPWLALLLTLAALWLRNSWLLLAPAVIVAVWRIAFWQGFLRNRTEQSTEVLWGRAYREMYYRLSVTTVPSLIAAVEDGTTARDADAPVAARASLIASGAANLPEALLRAARLPDAVLTGAVPARSAPHLPPVLRPLAAWWQSIQPLDSTTRARYCAAYDFFFQPQVAFHAALEALDEPTAAAG